MATVYSSETQIGTYIKGRVCVEYSGTSATCWFEMTRTNGSYSGYNGYNNFTFNGVTNRVYISNVSLSAGTWTRVGSVNASISMSGGNYSYSQTEYSYFAFSGSVYIPAQAQQPTNLSIASYYLDYNDVSISSTCTGMKTGSYNLVHKVIEADGEYFGDVSRYNIIGSYSSNFYNVNGTVNNSSTCGAGGCLNLCGGLKCRLGVGLEGAYNTSVLSNNLYLPLAPLQYVRAGEPELTSEGAVFPITFVGRPCDDVNNSSTITSVNTQYNYAFEDDEDGLGSGWITALSGKKPGEDLTTVHVTVPYGTRCYISAREYYPAGGVYSIAPDTVEVVAPERPSSFSGYIGVGGVARKCSTAYIGVGGTARKVIKMYIGVGGKARLVK